MARGQVSRILHPRRLHARHEREFGYFSLFNACLGYCWAAGCRLVLLSEQQTSEQACPERTPGGGACLLLCSGPGVPGDDCRQYQNAMLPAICQHTHSASFVIAAQPFTHTASYTPRRSATAWTCWRCGRHLHTQRSMQWPTVSRVKRRLSSVWCGWIRVGSASTPRSMQWPTVS